MSNTKRLLSLILAVVMVFSLAAMVTGCKKDPGTADDATNPTVGETQNYSVTVQTAGGMPMAGVAAYVYADDTLKDLKTMVMSFATRMQSFAVFNLKSKDFLLSSVIVIPAIIASA